MKSQRVLVIVHKDLVPPDSASREVRANAEWKTEYDVVHTLQKIHHDVQVVGIHGELKGIRDAIENWKPHIVFNLLEEFDGVALYDQNVVSYLELLRMPYTGCNPRGLMLARNKALTKKILTYHRIPVPKFVVSQMGRKVRCPTHLQYPLIVKSVSEESSLGISQASVVYDENKLKERVQFIHESIGTDALVEKFIEGRELYVSLMGNNKLDVFPIWELKFPKASQHDLNIATEKIKWDKNYQKKLGITSDVAKKLPESLEKKIQHICKRVYRSLELNGYARIDLRLSPANEIYVIEANPNPDISKYEDFSYAIRETGLTYEDMITKILNMGLSWRKQSA